MAVNFQDYIEYLKTQNIRYPIYKIALLRNEDESVYKEITGDVDNSNGALTIALNSGIRRTCNFNIINLDNSYTNTISNLTLGSKFQLWLGDMVNGEPYLFSQGIFAFDDPSLVSNLSDRHIEISGSDKWSFLNGTNGGILEGSYLINAGKKVGDIVRSILGLNIVSDPKPPLIDVNLENVAIPYDIQKEAGAYVSDILLDVALAISCYIYYDNNGYLVLEPFCQDIQRGSIFDFDYNEFNYLGSKKRYLKSDVYNSALVVADNTQSSGTPIIYEAINNSLSDPNSVLNLNRKKVKKITEYTNGIDTVEKAQRRAEWELQQIVSLQSKIDINSLPIYHLDVNQVITLNDDYVNSNRERFLIQNINLPINTSGQSTISCVKALTN